ncbi:chalcone isomerase family protein [Sulfuricystis multivorans]|uniref:chalcone isomerase family protein n=1 Tax=Sulfuricystis multivorans TaxID=2211108 RepID=UPI000F845892|nr:chalcone isomerase family protein [Sulfuricystis multivorans]
MRSIGKKTISALVFAALLGAAGAAKALEVAGVKVEERVQTAGKTLTLNGAGLRTKLFFKVYVAALYVEKPSREATAVISSPGARRVVLSMLRELDAETLYGALEEGLRNNLTDAERAVLKTSIEALAATMRAIGKVLPGDTVTLDFSADGLAIAHNGKPKGRIADEGIGPAVLKVWLGEKPAEESLKQALLGH